MFYLGTSFAAQTRTLDVTLDDAIALALDESYRARHLRLDLQDARFGMEVAKRSTRARMHLSLRAPDYIENVQAIRVPNQLPIYNKIGMLQWFGSVSVAKPFVMTDGELTLGSNFRQLRESVFQEQINLPDRSKRFFSTLSVRFRQPLFAPNRLKLNLERARLQLEDRQRVFTSAQLDIIYEITQEFYDFYSAQRLLEIAREALIQKAHSFDLARKKYEAGLIPEVEALQMEVAMSRSQNQLLQAEGRVARNSDRLKLALGLLLDDSLTVRPDMNLKIFEIDEGSAISHGLRHSTSLRQREIGRRLAEISLRETRADGTLRGEFSASYERTGFTNALPENTSTSDLMDASWQDLRRRPRNLGMNFTLTVPLWDSGLNRARVSSAKTKLDQRSLDLEDERQKVVLQIRGVIARLREARDRLEVLKKSEDVALRSYEIDRSRFENGDISAQDLTRTWDDLTHSRQAYLDAYIQYQLAVADLKRQTFYDFEEDRSLVDDRNGPLWAESSDDY
ncbi:MAG: TolC family protein [Candidatus Latescibacteria bacterium]|nr:TolC family protein [Candidatus Latescibacterota bacterium]